MNKLTYSEVEDYPAYPASSPYFGNILSHTFVHLVIVSVSDTQSTVGGLECWDAGMFPATHLKTTSNEPHTNPATWDSDPPPKVTCIFMIVHPLPGISPTRPNPSLFSCQNPTCSSKPRSVVSFYHGLSVCVPSKFICWNLGAQCESISSWDIWKVVRSWGCSPYEYDLKVTLQNSLAPSGRIQREVCSLEEWPHLTMLAPWSQTSSLQNCKQYIAVVL